MYAQKLSFDYAHTLHTVRIVHNAHSVHRSRVQKGKSCDCINFVRATDLAYKYGYDTPESFTKAFTRFHGIAPKKIKGDTSKIKVFLPLRIIVSIKGGYDMDYVVEKMESMKMIGFKRFFSFETSYEKIPKFWSEFTDKCNTGEYSKEEEKIIEECCIGEFGICICDDNN